MKILKRVSGVAVAAVALLGSSSALEVADLVTPLTRSYADRHFTKDYNFRVLEDNSVRRTWQLDGKQIIIDFDIATEKALSIYVVYEPSVDKQTATADFDVLVKDRREGSKWSKTKKEATERVGISNARLMRLNDKSLLFWESADSSSKCKRLCWFAEAPRINRMSLGNADVNSGRTAMGNRGSAGVVQQLMQDEERRMRVEPVPVGGSIAAATVAKNEGAKANEPVKRPKPTRPVAAADEPVRTPAGEPVRVAVAADDEPVDKKQEEAANLLEALGVKIDMESDIVKWAGAGIGLLLLIFIWGAISSARRKARQRAAFEQLLSLSDRRSAEDEQDEES